jgi:hypothetical protein
MPRNLFTIKLTIELTTIELTTLELKNIDYLIFPKLNLHF